MNQIAINGEDPFKNYEHFEKVLGPEIADKMRAKDKGLQANKAAQEKADLGKRVGPGPADQTRMAPPQGEAEDELSQAEEPARTKTKKSKKSMSDADFQKKLASVLAGQSGPSALPGGPQPQQSAPAPMQGGDLSFEKVVASANISDQLKDHIKTIFEKAKKGGVRKDMLGKYLVNMLPSSEDTAYTDPQDTEFLKKLENTFTPVGGHFGGGNFGTEPLPPGPNWQTVAKMTQKKMPLPPTSTAPAQQVLPQNKNLEDFLSIDPNPKFPQGKTPVPSLVKRPPVQDLGNEIQVGSEKQPGMLPRSLMLPQVAKKKLVKKQKKK